MGSKFRCIRSTPIEMQSVRENGFECFAKTGVNTPGYNVSKSGVRGILDFPELTYGPPSPVGFNFRVAHRPPVLACVNLSQTHSLTKDWYPYRTCHPERHLGLAEKPRGTIIHLRGHKRGYSLRNATTGLTFVARRAGT